MNSALWAVLGGGTTVVLLLLGVTLTTLLDTRRSRARERADLASAQADVEALRRQVVELSAELSGARRTAADVPETEYLITDAGGPAPEQPPVPERAVLAVTLGEPLVKLAAFGYGLRRALSAETRNRIAFEMRREVKRARKLRRRAARRTRLATAQTAHTEETAA